MGLPPNALEERPYAFALTRQQVVLYCNQCLLSMTDLKRCSACRSVSYCSADCQKEDWKLHKFECKAIRAHGEVPKDSIRLAMRIIGLVNKKQFGEVTESYIPGETRSFFTLRDYEDQEDPVIESLVEEFMKFAQPPLPELETVKMVFRKISLNSFSISNSSGNAIGVSVCIKLSAARHSCKPTTRVVFRNQYAMLAPIGDRIPTTLEGATHSFIDDLMPLSMRQSVLKNKYKFDCDCEACLDEERNSRMEAYSCKSCGTGWLRNRPNSFCGSCGWIITQDHYELCHNAEQHAIEHREHLYSGSIPEETKKNLCENLLKLFHNSLHEFNVHRIPVLRTVWYIALSEQNAPKALNAAKALLKISMEYQSPTDVAVLYQKHHIAQVLLATGSRAEAINLLNEIQEPLEKIYTKDSPILRSIYVTNIQARNPRR